MFKRPETREGRQNVSNWVDNIALLFYDLLLLFTLIGAPMLQMNQFPSVGFALSVTASTIVVMAFIRDWLYQCGLGKAAWVSFKRVWLLVFTVALIVVYSLTGWFWAVYLNWLTVATVLIMRMFTPGFGYHRRSIQVYHLR